MSLISVANLKLLTDKLAWIYDRWATELGKVPASPNAGEDLYLLNNALAVLTTTVDDYEQQVDMASAFYTVLNKTDRKSIAKGVLQAALSSINDHLSVRGKSVDNSILDLASYLNYYNLTAFTALLHPVFGDLFFDIYGQRLPASGLMQPALHPDLTSGFSSSGMGKRAVGGGFVAGTGWESTPLYAEVAPTLEVTIDFSSGVAPPTFTVAGTDNTGATSTTWTGSGTGNNPASAVSTTITPAITAMAKQTFAIGSATGIHIGSVLTINAGLIDQEVIVVENLSGSDVTATCRLAHTGGAALTGKTTIVLTPSVSGRRLRTVSTITITISSHAAGTVRVVGPPDRLYDPTT